MFPAARVWVAVLVALTIGAPPQGQKPDQSADAMRQADELLANGRYAEAAQLLEPVAVLASGDHEQGELQFLAGQAYYRLGKYDRAEQFWQAAVADERATNDQPHLARTLLALAQMRKNQASYEDGLALAHDALDIYTKLDDARDAALSRIAIGAIHDLKGEYREALATYDQAQPVLAGETTAQAAHLAYERGITLKNLGRYAEALAGYQRAYEIYAGLDDVPNEAIAVGNMGVLYTEIGEQDRALQFNHRALDLALRSGQPRLEMLGLVNVAGSYWDIGDRAHARAALGQELAIARRIGAKSDEASALQNLGEIDEARGEPRAALANYTEALAIRRGIGDRAGAASTLIARSGLALGRGDLESARRDSNEALGLARAMERPEREWDALRASAAVDAAAGRRGDAIEKLRESVRIIDTLRGALSSDAGKIAYLDNRRIVFEQLALDLIDEGRPGEALEAAEAGRARAFADLLESRKQALAPDAPARGRELASLQTAASPSLEDIRSEAARLNGTFVEYLTAEDRVLIWTVAPDGALHSAAVRVGRRRLEQLTRRVRSAIEKGAAGATTAHALLRTLDRDLIAPVERWLPQSADDSVVMMPYGPLLLVPFAALENARGQPLIARHALAAAPAVSVFEYTADKRRAAATHARSALIVADPIPPAESRAERLPGADVEGQRIAQRFGSDARLLTGADATESAVRQNAARYGVLHFAVHGVIVPDRPLASSLLLGAGDGDDGYLRVDEIFGMTLAARLVVLSGCSTGLGRLTGDGVLGMTRAFLYAGTPAVIVSQWDVSDRATATLMDHFYAELLDGRTTAQALRSAALATRTRYPLPADWAAFELVGEPQ
ncbi:MAG: CHAT domain-containing protein [Vicinamibacterales bacterium]